MKQGFLWKNEDEIHSGLKGDIPEKMSLTICQWILSPKYTMPAKKRDY